MARTEKQKAATKAWYEKNKHDRERFQQYENKYREKLKSDPKGYSRLIREKNLRAKYGITLEEFDLLVEKQNNKCPICQKDLLEGQIDVDHCHATNKVRAVLHNKCNRLLACCEDSIETLQRAIDYLKEHQCHQ